MNTSVSEPAPGLRARARALIEHPRFDQAIIALIVANAITLGLETSPAIAARFGDLLHAIDRTVQPMHFIEKLGDLLDFIQDNWRLQQGRGFGQQLFP